MVRTVPPTVILSSCAPGQTPIVGTWRRTASRARPHRRQPGRPGVVIGIHPAAEDDEPVELVQARRDLDPTFRTDDVDRDPVGVEPLPDQGEIDIRPCSTTRTLRCVMEPRLAPGPFSPRVPAGPPPEAPLPSR